MHLLSLLFMIVPGVRSYGTVLGSDSHPLGSKRYVIMALQLYTCNDLV